MKWCGAKRVFVHALRIACKAAKRLSFISKACKVQGRQQALKWCGAERVSVHAP